MNDDGGFTNKFIAKSKMRLVLIILCDQISKVGNIKNLKLYFLTLSPNYSGGPSKVRMHSLCRGGRHFLTKCDLRVTHATNNWSRQLSRNYRYREKKKFHRYVNNARYFLLSIRQGNSFLACTEIGNSENIIKNGFPSWIRRSVSRGVREVLREKYNYTATLCSVNIKRK